MACVAFTEGRVAIAHVGDARVYALTASGALRLTRDHTLSESHVARAWYEAALW